ncbi:restriction endonuclease subunit S [Pseudoalteromonas sp. PPB1]|uniref:restriction endonuclease subunit S n=1 Tax=Pseudoalteromonas sp. PPB1 TaxID=2756136 RepID=UPI001891A3F0|nr:restriction endonuclease subunit S [Pseudoalteromonas sp. PPB1]
MTLLSETKKYQAYPKYENSGVDWLGSIPVGWKPTRLKHVVHINMGQSPNSDDCNIEGCGLPFLQGNAEFTSKSPQAKQFCPIPKKVAKKGELLFSVRAPVGALNIADIDYGIGRGLCSLNNTNKVDTSFLWWLLPTYKFQFDAIATGSTFEAVSAEQVGNLAFALPCIQQQLQIASFLDHETAKIDTLIEKQKQLIKLLKEKRQAVISHAVTKGLNSQAPMKDSGVEWLGEVPAHWSVTPLAGVADVIDPNPSHRNPKYTDDGFPFISTVEFTGIDNVEINTPRRVAEETVLEQENRCNFQEGSIAFSRKGTIGAVRILPHGIRFALLDSVCVINCGETVLYEFLYQQCRSSLFESQLGAETRGAALKQVSVGRVRAVKTFTPPLEEQKEILAYLNEALSKLDKTVELANKQVNYLTERRTALISAAVTGKIDVRNWQRPEVSKEEVA